MNNLLTEHNLEQFISLNCQSRFRKEFNKQDTWHAIVDVSDGRLLSLCEFLDSAKKINNNFLNTALIHNVNLWPGFFPEEFNINKSYDFCFRRNRLIFVYRKTSFQEKLELELFKEKSYALDYVVSKIISYLKPFESDIPTQYHIYRFKFEESLKILKGGITDPDIECPFVYEYSQIENIDLIDAAKEIKLKYEIWQTKLSSIETLRIRTSKKIIKCDTIFKIPDIIKDFEREGRTYVRF